MSNAIVNYGSYDIEAADTEHEDLSRGGGNYMKLEVGRNVVRFLPPPPGRNTPFVTTFQHFLNLPGIAEPVIFNCPRLMARRGCPACAKGEKLKATGNPKDADAARDFWSSRRVFASVVDRNDEDAGPKILGFGKMIHEALVAIRRDEDAGGDFTHPEEGFDVIIERTGSGKTDTRYTVRPARKSSPLGNFEWIETQPDLRHLAKVPTIEEIKAMVNPDDGSSAAGPTAQDDVNVVADAVSDDDIPF
jgi:hypothetical protein